MISLRCTAIAQGKDGDSLFSFRVDGVTINTVTIGAGLVGNFGSDGLAIQIVAGTDTNFQRDCTASTLGNITYAIQAMVQR